MGLTSTLRSAVMRIAMGGDPVHAVPVFEGTQSHRLRTASLRELRTRALANLRHVPAFLRAETIVAIAGDERADTALLGAIVDAHPNARMAVELDVVGLIGHGLRWPEVVALVDDNSRRFRSNGRWWQGSRHAPEPPLPSREVQVIGDRSADRTVAHVVADPTVLDRLRERVGNRRVVVIVATRNPFEEVAAASLRAAREREREQESTRIRTGVNPRVDPPVAVSDDAIAAHRRRADHLAVIMASGDTVVVAQEELHDDPTVTIRRVYEELGLSALDDVVDTVAEIVAPRDRPERPVDWTPRQIEEVAQTIAAHSHLDTYRDVDPPALPDLELQVSLVSCAGVNDGVGLLPAFLDHYTDLGIAAHRMHVILNAMEADSPGLAAAIAVLEARGVSTEHVWIGPYHSLEMWNRRRALQQEHVDLDGWIVNADVDEFNVFPDGLGPLVRVLRDNGYLGVQGPMIDRIAADGSLPEVDPAANPFEQFPVAGDLMTRLPQALDLSEGAGTSNLVLHAACVLPSAGGHAVNLVMSLEWLEETAAQEGCAPQDLLDHAGYPDQVRRRWRHVVAQRRHMLHGTLLRDFPRIRDSRFRFTFPIHSNHFKWHAGFRRDLDRRLERGDQSDGARRYTMALLDQFESNGWRVPLDTFLARDEPAPTDWRDQAATLRAYRQAILPALTHGHRQRRDTATAADGWAVRQLTAGTGTWSGHMHCYYDIRVLDTDETRLVAIEVDHHSRPIAVDDEVRVGMVDVVAGGFVPLATTTAWSWQQGPLAQWIPEQDRIICNVRADGGLASIMIDPDDPGPVTRLSRPVYALASTGDWALSIDLLRLDELRPGYGYAAPDAAPLARAPADDGIWRVDLATDESRLVLSLAEAVEATARAMEARDPVLARDLRDEGFHFWFNHLKLSPDDRRLTCKLRWRHPDGPWSDLQGVSLTVDVERDGSDPHLLAWATSHVMWWSDEELYYWDAAARDVMRITDRDDAPPRSLHPGQFDRNVHLRHLPDQPHVFVYDEPYQPEVTLHRFDLDSGESRQLARFPFHLPSRGLYRCDLHPVPTRGGDRIIVTSLVDGRRQLYSVEREPS